jgi:hypothetical protein
MSVPAGLMQALQSGAGASPGAPGGPAAGGPPPAPIQIGGDAGAGAATKSDGDWEEDLRNALDALRTLASDAQDHVEANIVDKCIAALSGLTSKRQGAAESALGVTPAHKSMSRAYG